MNALSSGAIHVDYTDHFICLSLSCSRERGQKRRVNLERSLRSQGTNFQSDLFLMSFEEYLKFGILSILVRLWRYLAMWLADMDEHNKLLKASYFVVRSLPEQMDMERGIIGVNCYYYINDTEEFCQLRAPG